MAQHIQLALFEEADGTHRLNMVTADPGYTFTAEEVSGLIATLANTRVAMLPAEPMEPAQQVAGMQNVANEPPMRWFYDEMNDKAALVLRHPGFGWIGYALTIETVQQLQDGLQKIVDHRNSQRRSMN
ncbi:hypothetical protein Q8F57_027105 [Paraburkholderia terrae]|uniref:hypothetical protein n=1 Tax=Paraburkholderia terrae TaxID=311230 RepID=UPI00296A92EC|nr:hypothetical protein [Paraburkholderia terrae]MDW3660287.1 hypothetical protein [Paraburkholderia terrae]